MKKIIISLLALLSLLLTACKGEESTPDTGNLQLELSMPAMFSGQEISQNLGYFWQEDDLVTLEIRSGGKSLTLHELTPTRLSDGQRATLSITLPEDMPTTGLTIRGEVKRKGNHLTPTLLAYQAPLQDNDKNPSFNLREKGINPPIYLPETTLHRSPGKQSLQLSTLGHFSIIELSNQSDQPLTAPKELQLTSDTPWLWESPTSAYDYVEGKLKGEKSLSSLPLTFNAQELQPKKSQKILLWLPEANKDTKVYISATDIESNAVPFSDEMAISLETADKISLSTQLFTYDPANSSGGGDPYFAFRDIKYWIGSGSKKAALVINWHDGKQPEALVWGYRFDGKKSTGEMLEEIANQDPRLLIAIGEGMNSGTCLFSIAYRPVIGTTPYEIRYQGKTLTLKSQGVHIVDFDPKKDYAADHFTISDPTARWQTGFYDKGYWSYFHKERRLNPFGYSNFGYWNFQLIDGSWHGISWSPLNNGSMKGELLSTTFTAATIPVK